MHADLLKKFEDDQEITREEFKKSQAAAEDKFDEKTRKITNSKKLQKRISEKRKFKAKQEKEKREFEEEMEKNKAAFMVSQKREKMELHDKYNKEIVKKRKAGEGNKKKLDMKLRDARVKFAILCAEKLVVPKADTQISTILNSNDN